jgi:hypothetical protein
MYLLHSGRPRPGLTRKHYIRLENLAREKHKVAMKIYKLRRQIFFNIGPWFGQLGTYTIQVY